MSGPSDKAVEAALLARQDEYVRFAVREALDAAHHPALGLDRSVCLRDVVEWLWSGQSPDRNDWGQCAEAIEREFGGEPS